MNKTNYGFNTNKGSTARMSALLEAMATQSVTPDMLTGKESLSLLMGSENFSLGTNPTFSFAQQQSILSTAAFALSGDEFTRRLKSEGEMIKTAAGFESFSAVTVELNGEANKQFDAAEAMYPTIKIGTGDQMIELPIDIAGVGHYNVGGNVNDAYEDMRPIVSTLTDSKFDMGDELRLVPVFKDDPTDPGYKKFVDKADWPVQPVTYDADDLLNRGSHQTNFLRPTKFDNLMNLCNAPGAEKFQNSDEIEATSIKVKRVLIKLKTKDGEGIFAIDTLNYSGNAMRVGGSLNSKVERQLILKTVNSEPAKLLDKDGKDAKSLFTSLGALVPNLYWDMTLTYNRDTRGLTVNTSEVLVNHVMDGKNRLVTGASRTPDEVNALIAAQAVEGSIIGFELQMNHSNVDWSRYGQTIVYAQTNKQYNVRSRTPVHVRYAMDDDNNNAEVLSKCVKNMALLISRNMTHDAFKAAVRHFDYIMENNNKQVVPIHDLSNDVLPAQYFFTTTGRDDKLTLKTAVSTLDTKDALGNIQASFVNKITDVLTDIRVRSGFAGIKEVDTGRFEEYTIVAHSSLAPFLITMGDVRTFGNNVKFTVIETNVDTEKDRFWVFPSSQTKDGSIDAFGGFGICVTRDLLVIEGDVRSERRQFRMLITQPSYEHHSIGCVAARVTVTDYAELMAEGGVLSAITRHLVNVNGTLDGVAPAPDAGDEIDVTPGG